MTRKPKATRKPRAIPELAKHHARPPHHLGKVKAHFDGDTLIIEVNSAAGKEAKEVKDSLERRWGPNLINNAERKMREILETARMPTEAGVVTPTDRGAVRGLDELAKRRDHSIGSEVWYAAKIVEEMAYLRRAMAGGNPDAILDAALHLGSLMREAMIVVDNPGVFDLGLKQDAALEKARKAAAEQNRAKVTPEHQRWIDHALTLWKEEPSLSASECARKVISLLDLSQKESTVRQVIGRRNPLRKKIAES